MYSTWRIAELKRELKNRGASQQGKKAELVARLEAYDRNFNFENIASRQNSPEPQMKLPHEGEYRDVNSNTLLPSLTRQHIHLYFSRFNKKTDDGFSMYENRYLLVLRSCIVGEWTYVKGLCKASMKKLQYEVNIKLQHNGTIEECACECAVGSGKEAHCKHVAVVMFAVEHMYREKIVLLDVVCTQKLQTFHQPRKLFTASPLKADRLPSKRRLSNIIFHPYEMDICKEEYNAKVRNICIADTSSSMPLKQRYGPANPFAIINDHIYVKDPRETLLESLLLKNVSSEKIKQIELMTRGQSTNKMWHEKRQDRITASYFHTVCHLTAHRQRSFAEQMLTPKTHFTSRATNHGIINEPVAINMYMELYGLEVQNCGLFLSEKYPFLGASPDGLLGDETIIEVKCPYASRNQEINDRTVPYLCNLNGELGLKKTCIYYYQIQGQLLVTNKKFCNLIIYTFKDIKVIFISRDEEFIKNMLKVLINFYDNYFKDAVFNKYIYRNYKTLCKSTIFFYLQYLP